MTIQNQNRYLLLLLLFFSSLPCAFPQLGLAGGINGFTVSNHSLVGEISPKANIHLGLFWETKLLKSNDKLYFRTDAVLVGKGYKQKINQEGFTQNFTYVGLWPSLQYRFSDIIGSHAGVEMNGLYGTNSNNGTSVYQRFECATFLGLDLFPKKQFSYFIRTSIGLTPVLDYKQIDPIEGIVGDFKDMYFRGILVGVNFKFP